MAFERLAFERPAFDELGLRFAFEGVFDRFACDCLVDPELAELERFVLALERDAPPRPPRPRD